MEIRNPDKTHLPAVFSLLQRCFPGAWTDAEIADRIFYDALYDPNHVWMAREKGQVLGFAVSVQDRDQGWLKLLAVDEERRRGGLGADLLSRAEFRLSGEGVVTWRIGPTPPREFLPGVEPGSTAASFFVAQGFKDDVPLLAGWLPSPGPGGTECPEPDRAAAAAFAKARCQAHWPWVEEQLSFRPARAVFLSGAGLCLADPGRGVGPLWAAPDADAAALKSLALGALAIAASAPTTDPLGLRVWQVSGSSVWPLAVAVSRTYNTYVKVLS